jgi:hypothetical protein
MKFEMLEKNKDFKFFTGTTWHGSMVSLTAGQPEAIFLVVSDPSMNEL